MYGVRHLLNTVNGISYKAFGFNIISEIPLPELTERIDISENEIDIIINRDNLITLWNELSTQKKKYVVTDQIVMFDIPDIAIFSIEDGKKISVSPKRGYDEEIARLYILGTCMGALLMQRRLYPLHGSAIVIDGNAYAFIGDSGAGKSTLAATFINRGYQLLSDDVICVSFTKKNAPIITPSYPQQKLWQESLDLFGMNSNQFKPLYERETKYAIPVDSNFFSDPLPLAGVFELVKTDEKQIGITSLNKLDRLNTLFAHTYRNFLIPRLDLVDWHFQASTKILNHVRMYQLQRPKTSFTAHHLVSLVLNTLNQEVGTE